MTRTRAHQRRPSTRQRDEATAAAILLYAQLDRLADDAWTLAQRSPALVADPALVQSAAALLLAQRRALPREPNVRLLPAGLAPGMAFHALALTLRQMRDGLRPLVARIAPPPPRAAADDIDDIVRLQALILRDLTAQVAERSEVKLPPDLRPVTPPPPAPPRGEPPAPRPRIPQARLRHGNRRRRVRRTVDAAA